MDGTKPSLTEKEDTPPKRRDRGVLTELSALSLQSKQKPSVNLVVCGRTEDGFTTVAKSILGGADLPIAPSPGQCVKHQGEVCGRWVSLVELPALSGKPLEAVMQQCLSCISLCGPEGVHAFILVLPVGPLSDEDKAELQTIQDTFSSAVNPFTMILFTVDSDPTTAVVVEADLLNFCQSCGRGTVILHTRGKQVSELLDSIDALRFKDIPHSNTTEAPQQASSSKLLESIHLEEHFVEECVPSVKKNFKTLLKDMMKKMNEMFKMNGGIFYHNNKMTLKTEQEMMEREQEKMKREQEKMEREQEKMEREQEKMKREQEKMKREQEKMEREQEKMKREREKMKREWEKMQREQEKMEREEREREKMEREREKMRRYQQQMDERKEKEWAREKERQRKSKKRDECTIA